TADSTVVFLWDDDPMRYKYDNKGPSESSALIDAFANEKNYIFYHFPVNISQMLAMYREPYVFDYPVYESGRIEFMPSVAFGEAELPMSSEYYFIELSPMTSTMCEVYVQTCILTVKSRIVLRNVATNRQREYKGDVTVNRKVAAKVKVTKTPINETLL
ncbi:MAG: hypothetical protein K2J74_05630, partial [Muribaculaceae bacterium]|nr:hypothetical protein [Muribaculaceae bacterium]